MFVGILLRDSARNVNVEIQSSRHREIFEISGPKTIGSHLKLYFTSLVYHRNISGSSSKVFGNLRTSSEIFENSRKMLVNVRLAFGTVLENLRKSSENN